jgi:hypothetical protein
MTETMNAVFKGLGRRPTSLLLRWKPSLKNPFRFGLVEVMRCHADGQIVMRDSSQSALGMHLGHQVKSPSVFSVWEWIKVQLRIA